MAAEKNIPEIRFKGFEGEWEVYEIKELADRYDNLRVPITASDRISGNTPYYGANGIQDYVEGFTHDGEYILVAEDGANDLKNYPVQYVNGKIWVNNHTHVLQGKAYVIDNKYLKYAISQTNIEPFLVGGGRAKLNAETMMKIEIVVSTHFNEQTQIGTYFQHLDSLISLHQRKYDKLLTVKKAMLEKMFPKDGADVPEIRFKGFEGKWKEKTLGIDIADIIGGGTPSTFEQSYWNGSIDWYSPTEIGKSVFAFGSEKKITELGLKNCSAKFLPADKTILFTSRAGIGDMAILKKTGTTNQGFQSLVLKENYDTYFIYSIGHLIKKYALKNSSGSTFLEISGKVLGKMILLVPSFEEQTQIGTFFQNLDTIITQHQKQLERLKNIKKACLEKMFV